MCGMMSVGLVGAALISFAAVVVVLAISVLLIGASLIFTNWRYREIAKLSQYLQRISGGEYTLDVRDNYEGELSILKNNIYKVTTRLAEQGAVLQEDKIKLTNAISDISHQLKTPLTSMMMMADLLREPQLPDAKRSEFTHNIQVQLERIDWLVSSLLKLSKIDAGTVVFKREEIAVKDLIQRALKPLLIPIDIKELTISVRGEDTVTFVGDRNWTVEALINIFKNCIEHTPEKGSLAVTFSENALFTEIMITDTGKGIAKEDLPYIFKRFYKGKNASEESVGIGLAMAHSIITKQNGSIEVSSILGEGTEFRIQFFKGII